MHCFFVQYCAERDVSSTRCSAPEETTKLCENLLPLLFTQNAIRLLSRLSHDLLDESPAFLLGAVINLELVYMHYRHRSLKFATVYSSGIPMVYVHS